MRVKVNHEGDGDHHHPAFVIETAEDCQLAQQRLDALNAASRGENEQKEADALTKAIERWHRDHARAGGRAAP